MADRDLYAQNIDLDSIEFTDHLESLPVGEKYAEVTDGTITVRKGDFLAFDDPDVGGHADGQDRAEDVHSRLFVGKITGILDRGDRGEPQLFVTTPTGRIDLVDPNVHISGEGVLPDPQSGTDKFISRLVDSWETDDRISLTVEWGEGIGDDGEDWRQTWG